MWQSFHDAWWRLATQNQPRSSLDALACGALWTVSLAYRAAAALRNVAYDRRWVEQVRLPCRVVSVGNLTLGGTGKTACVELITRKLIALGKRVTILSRGYGGRPRDYWLRWEGDRLVVNGNPLSSRDGLADEPQLLARHLEGIPVIVGARRDRTGRVACDAFAADTVILDDGFQHRRVQRDCEIVVVQARMPLGGLAMLPRGPMREPLASLKRAHIVIVTKADEALEMLGALFERLRSFNPEATFVSAVHEPTSVVDGMTGEQHGPERLSGLRVGLVSSIGDPAGFEATVRRLQATVLWHWMFPDHYAYHAADVAAILERARESRPDAVVTTEKDWVRLQPWTGEQGPWAVSLWVLGVQMKVLSGEEALNARLAGLYAR